MDKSNEKIATVVEVSFNEVVNELSTVIFFTGCNLNCDYCYNYNLLHPHKVIDKSDWFDFEQLKDLITKKLFRFNDVNSGQPTRLTEWIVFSGGECIHNHFDEVVELNKLAKEKGFKTKLFTNGTHTHKLRRIITDFDCISLDVKVFYELYDLSTDYLQKINDMLGVRGFDYINNLKITLHNLFVAGVYFEVRTVAIKPLISFVNLIKIAKFINCYNPKKWFLTSLQIPSEGLNSNNYTIDNCCTKNELKEIKSSLEGEELSFEIILA